MRQFLLLFSILFTVFTSYSQGMKISGTVYDSTGTQAIPDAIAIAVRLKDSVLLDFSRTDEKGKFELKNVPIDTFNLIISHFRLDDRSYFIFGSEENKEIDIPNIFLSVKPKEIQEVIVYANKNPIYFRGDTLVYVADSFKVKENAVVEDLLKKLPGITVDENGVIKAQGKEISKVFVDGDEFFGADPTIATKNLGAKGVETVEVYEKKNEDAAEGEDETIQVLNLTLKEEAKKGFFGRVSAASDLTQFYEGELLFNKFSNTQKLSVFLLGSNTPRSKFNWQDINQFGLDNEGGWKQNEEGDWYPTGSAQDGNGIPQTLRSGIYFSDKIGKKKQSKITFDYTYNNYRLNSISQSYTQYFLSDSSYYSADSTRTITKNESHSANFTFHSQLDSLTSIEIKPSFKFSDGNTETADYSHYLTSEKVASRSNIISKGNDSKGVNFDSEVIFKRAFKKERREFKARYDLSLGKNRSEGDLNFEDLYFLGTAINDTTNQIKINENSRNTQSGKITYTEPLSKKIKLESEYFFEHGSNDQVKETRNILSDENTEIDSSLTNSFENIRIQNRLGLNLVYESRKHTISAGAKYRNILIDNRNLFTEATIQQNVSNFLPRVSYTFKPNQTSRLSAKYTTSSSQPSVNALQPIPDNTNPNRIKVGNPDLIPTFQHSVNINYNSWNALKNRYFWSGMNAYSTDNAFVDSTTFDADGRQYSKTVNADGNFFAVFWGGASLGIYKKILSINPSVSASYNKNFSFINGTRNETIRRDLAGELGLELNLDSLSFNISAEYGYSNPTSTINAQLNKPYSNQKYSANLNWTLPWWHLSIKSDLNYTINGQRAEGYNLNYLIWNASIDKAFFKTENLILSLQGNDILNQNIIAQRNVSSNMITDYKTKVISRYFLVKLTFKFTNKTTNTEEDDLGE